MLRAVRPLQRGEVRPMTEFIIIVAAVVTTVSGIIYIVKTVRDRLTKKNRRS